jgi:hypothetical protein
VSGVTVGFDFPANSVIAMPLMIFSRNDKRRLMVHPNSGESA